MTEIDLYKVRFSPFWTFSLGVYGREGVPAACLVLQDKTGADVNVVLFSLFLGRCSRELAPTDLAAIAETVEPWRRDLVAVLRSARRALKSPPSPFEGPAVDMLRKTVKGAELEAERIQQEMLYVTFPAESTGKAQADPVKACSSNIEAYGRYLGAEFDRRAVETLLDAAGATDVNGVRH